MTDKAMTDLGAASSFAAADTFLVRKSGETEDKSCSGTNLSTWILNSVITDANQLQTIAAGTAYSFTNTAAKIDFGTTDPGITLNAPGTYAIFGEVTVNYAGATFAASQDVTLKIRRTNNTAADLTGSTVIIKTGVVTTVTETLQKVNWVTLYSTSNTDDAIELWGNVAATPSAGSLQAAEARITAIRLQQ